MARSGLSAFLNTFWRVDGIPLVQPSNPVRWGRLAAALGLGTATSLTLGMQMVITSWFESITSVINSVTEFVVGREPAPSVADGLFAGTGDPVVGSGGLLGVLFDPITAAITGLWAFNVEQFGIFALPVSLIIILTVVYLFSQAALRAYHILLGRGWV